MRITVEVLLERNSNLIVHDDVAVVERIWDGRAFRVTMKDESAYYYTLANVTYFREIFDAND
jgi:hypothetical protein